MTARPMTEGERQRERALYIAQEIETGLNDPKVPGCQFRAFVKTFVSIDDISFMAEALLSTSSEVRRLREALEERDEHIGALLRIFDGCRVNNDKDAARLVAIANAFGERALSAALSVEGEDELARATPSAPISTDTKDATK